MRHGNKINHLGRKFAHRKALLMNLSNSLILHKRITTTLAKAKELRKHIEPLINKTKSDTTHNRRILFSYLQDKESIKELFDVIATKVADRPGGYTRIIKMGFRAGDAAEMGMIEFVDFNDIYGNEPKANSNKTRRGKKKGTDVSSSGSDVSNDTTATNLVEDVVSEEVVVEDTNIEAANVEVYAPATEVVVEETEAAEAITIAEAVETNSSADDLKIIEGVGPKIEEILHSKGITTFAQVVETPAETIKAWLEEAGPSFATHDPGTWAEQATLLRDGKMDEFNTLAEELKGGKRVD